MEIGAFRSVNFTKVLKVDDPSNRLPSFNGWTVLAAFGENFDYYEELVYDDRNLQDDRYWQYNHTNWIDTPSGSQTMYVGSSYWVALDNDDEIVGFSLPPVTFELDP